ncbi:hypothetical protein Tc00.1047053509437.170 [Trypanosoma cruzi]|uniref:Uncharacterized protein n=1 Tax=Trypanosoma cruzi (strain CL Brener) TaxID=353153 RepID=Q4DV85_TRYCC|nr:hypothetical protein Tc00.1047053509437.170 [Trypanosoma cruzi]EAN96445.1 hypothetical protein Tc00.1047053509437.170 [Trypanosoma cruzi]|eukprot:XP_818296.1 hypothetical protein [Trypanosoma cruzi strain CL Brener]
MPFPSPPSHPHGCAVAARTYTLPQKQSQSTNDKIKKQRDALTDSFRSVCFVMNPRLLAYVFLSSLYVTHTNKMLKQSPENPFYKSPTPALRPCVASIKDRHSQMHPDVQNEYPHPIILQQGIKSQLRNMHHQYSHKARNEKSTPAWTFF